MGKCYYSNFRFLYNSTLKLASLLLLLFSISESALASVGGDISWESEKKGEFKIKYRVYYNYLFDKVDDKLVLGVRCLETNEVDTFSYNLNSYQISDANPDCPDTSGFSQKRVHSFESFLDFNNDPFLLAQLAKGGCKFELELSTIWTGGNTLTYVFRGQFYISANLDICNITNTLKETDNSPKLPFNPNIIAHCNQHIYWSSGAYDTDRDSLVFSLIAPRNNMNSQMLYPTNEIDAEWPVHTYCRRYDENYRCEPRPERNPPEGFYFDKETSNMIFMPVQCHSAYQVVLKIDQYRLDKNGTTMLHLGYTTQEFQVNVDVYEDNHTPIIQGLSTKFICAGEKACFDFNVLDQEYEDQHGKQDWKDSLEITWNYSIPGAVLESDSNTNFYTENGVNYARKGAHFCWDTQTEDISNQPYFATVVARDKACPFNAVSKKTFLIYVSDYPTADVHFAQDSLGVLYFGSIPDEAGTYTHSWIIRDSTNSGTPVYTSQKELDSFSLPYPGTFVVTYRITNQANCSRVYVDTITICPDNNAPEIEDVVLNPVCAGDTLCFDVEVYDEQSSTQTWQDTIEMDWDRSITNATWEVDTPSFVTVNNIDYAYRKATFCWVTESKDGRFTPYIVHVFASDLACPAKAVAVKTVEINVFPNPEAQRLYTQDNLGKLIFESVPGNSSNAIHEWEIRDINNTGTPIYSSNELKDSFTFQQSGLNVLTYTMTDTITNCSSVFLDTIDIIINHSLSNGLIQAGSFKVYPNPANDKVFVESQSHVIQNLKMYDVSGKLIFDNSVGEKTFRVETQNLAPGTYIFEIKSNDQIVRMKHLIVR